MDEITRIKKCFCEWIEDVLINNSTIASEHVADDVISIGMGNQGIVRNKEELYHILNSTKKNEEEISKTTVTYSHMQIRYYGDLYASINAVLTVCTTIRDNVHTIYIGQCASMRKINDNWRIIMLQATPISMAMEELDAYPLAFAEEQIESYHAQEMLSTYKKQNMIASYKIDLTENQIEEYQPYTKQKYSYSSTPGSNYENELFKSVIDRLEGKTRIEFIQKFSVTNLKELFQAGQTEVSMQYETIQPNGVKLWLSTNVFLFVGKNDHLKAYLYLLDIDKEKKRELDLEYRAEMDLMTGLYNKAVVNQKIIGMIDTPLPYNQGVFLILDIDNFKCINDTYGHAVGDQMIQKIAQILKTVFEKDSIIGRIGGDEFCVFYTAKQTEDMLIKKLDHVFNLVHAIQTPNGNGSFSVSMGVAKRSNESFEEIFRKADKALYMRKQEYNKNGYTFYKE